ncbi:hypothetical protein H0H81_005484, partial [Sphagnurus paluster]
DKRRPVSASATPTSPLSSDLGLHSDYEVPSPAPRTLEQLQAEYTLRHVQSQISSLGHLFQTNNPPSDPELQQIARLLHNVNVELSKFNSQDLDQAFQIAVFDPLEHLRNALQGSVSPIRQLNGEILRRIFSECLPSSLINEKRIFWNFLDERESPWTLTRVSRRWREIILTDQRLWSSIDTDYVIRDSQ